MEGYHISFQINYIFIENFLQTGVYCLIINSTSIKVKVLTNLINKYFFLIGTYITQIMSEIIRCTP